MSFDEIKKQIRNEETLAKEQAADHWEDGDTCGEKGCEKCVHKVTHDRHSRLGTDPHPDAPTAEFVCVHHGVVAKKGC